MLSLAGAKLHLIFLICKILGSFFNSRASYFAVFGGRGLLTGAPLIIFTLCCSTSRTRAHHSTLPRGNGGMAIPYYILGRRRDFQIRSYQELTTYNS